MKYFFNEKFHFCNSAVCIHANPVYESKYRSESLRKTGPYSAYNKGSRIPNYIYINTLIAQTCQLSLICFITKKYMKKLFTVTLQGS